MVALQYIKNGNEIKKGQKGALELRPSSKTAGRRIQPWGPKLEGTHATCDVRDVPLTDLNLCTSSLRCDRILCGCLATRRFSVSLPTAVRWALASSSIKKFLKICKIVISALSSCRRKPWRGTGRGFPALGLVITPRITLLLKVSHLAHLELV